VQEAFLKLVEQRSQPDRPLAWLYRVVRNGAISAAVRIVLLARVLTLAPFCATQAQLKAQDKK
jgi:DNA-directed RNA polymerase specialized sigma24 family protein